jgi:tetratricopeptide (TPR) repeat protein/4-amino-4-deoxy-L-arabinose transferase-like glycosyltransferase
MERRPKKRPRLVAVQPTKATTQPLQSGTPCALSSSVLLVLAILFSVSCVIRIVYLFEVTASPVFLGLSVDSKEFDGLARQVLEGNFFHRDAVFLSPFYPLFLSALYFVFGYSHVAVIWVQGLLDILNCILLFYVSSRVFNRPVGIIASILYSFYGLTIFYTGVLLEPTATLFFLLLFLSAMVYAEGHGSMKGFLASGIALAIVFSSRPNVILFFLLLPLWFFFHLKTKLGIARTAKSYLAFCIGFFFILAGIAYRTSIITGNFSPLSAQGGFNFYIGNSPDASGVFSSPQGIATAAVTQIKESILYAEKETGRSLTPHEASDYWQRKGMGFILDRPGSAIELWIKKAVLFWRHEEPPLNINYEFSRQFIPVLRFPFISFGLIAPLALIGMALILKKREGAFLILLFLVAYMGSVVAFFVSDRYRLPEVPCLIIMASYLLWSLKQMAARREKRSLGIIFSVLFLLFILVNGRFSYFNFLDTRSVAFSNLGSVYFNLGQYHKAEEQYLNAIQANPNNISAHRNLASTYSKMGLVEKALRQYQEALSLDSTSYESHFGLGNLYQNQGQIEPAIQEYEKALASNPKHEASYYNLGNMYYQLGLMGKAKGHFEKAIAINPRNDTAYNNLGSAHYRLGQVDSAIDCYQKAIALNNGNADAHSNLGNMYFYRGQLDRAISQYRLAINADPGHSDAHANLGNVYDRQGRTEDAIGEWKRALEINPANQAAHDHLVKAKEKLNRPPSPTVPSQ